MLRVPYLITTPDSKAIAELYTPERIERYFLGRGLEAAYEDILAHFEVAAELGYQPRMGTLFGKPAEQAQALLVELDELSDRLFDIEDDAREIDFELGEDLTYITMSEQYDVIQAKLLVLVSEAQNDQRDT